MQQANIHCQHKGGTGLLYPYAYLSTAASEHIYILEHTASYCCAQAVHGSLFPGCADAQSAQQPRSGMHRLMLYSAAALCPPAAVCSPGRHTTCRARSQSRCRRQPARPGSPHAAVNPAAWRHLHSAAERQAISSGCAPRHVVHCSRASGQGSLSQCSGRLHVVQQQHMGQHRTPAPSPASATWW